METQRLQNAGWDPAEQPLESLEKTNKHAYAYGQIKAWIISGELAPDTMLVERQLCEMLELSRTPVRSALQELAKEGFALAAPGRGMMVSRVQLEDVVEIFEIRRALDVLALELFLKAPGDHVIARMRRTVSQMEAALRAMDSPAFMQADNAFHELYIHHTGNCRLERIWVDLSEQERRIMALAADDQEQMQRSYGQHCRIMEQIEAGDAETAASCLREHLSDSLEYHFQKMSRRFH